MIVTLLFWGAGGDRLSPAEANTILVPNATAGAWTPEVTFGHLALERQLPAEQAGQLPKMWTVEKTVLDQSFEVGFAGLHGACRAAILHEALPGVRHA
ncbi:MAG: hypothetical protein JJ920_16940 [Roseitalea sp.]|nr:hypothetical protein [Roseitalea sp.]MBO6721418.1 hypothetical protein [Roseitalea sp.]MBO6744603.1 hypothetical protein [Roseitalea sp.]